MSYRIKIIAIVGLFILALTTTHSCTTAPKHKSHIYTNDTTEAMRLLIDTVSNFKGMFHNNPYGDTVIVICENESLLGYLPENAICLSREQICNMAFQMSKGKETFDEWILPDVLTINEFSKEDSFRYNAFFTVSCLSPYRHESDGRVELDSLHCISNSMCGYGASMQFVADTDSLRTTVQVETLY